MKELLEVKAPTLRDALNKVYAEGRDSKEGATVPESFQVGMDEVETSYPKELDSVLFTEETSV